LAPIEYRLSSGGAAIVTVAHVFFAVLRLLLTFVFMVSALTKLTDQGRFQKALAGFLVPCDCDLPTFTSTLRHVGREGGLT